MKARACAAAIALAVTTLFVAACGTTSGGQAAVAVAPPTVTVLATTTATETQTEVSRTTEVQTAEVTTERTVIVTQNGRVTTMAAPMSAPADFTAFSNADFAVQWYSERPDLQEVCDGLSDAVTNCWSVKVWNGVDCTAGLTVDIEVYDGPADDASSSDVSIGSDFGVSLDQVIPAGTVTDVLIFTEIVTPSAQANALVTDAYCS
jgi:hypothetical protein